MLQLIVVPFIVGFCSVEVAGMSLADYFLNQCLELPQFLAAVTYFTSLYSTYQTIRRIFKNVSAEKNVAAAKNCRTFRDRHGQ